MRIGYLRYSQTVHLDFIKGSARQLGTELRLGILEAFLMLGHQVYMLSSVGKGHTSVLEGSGEYYDYSLFKNLIYSPDEIPKLDLVFIEGSTTNLMFGGKTILRTRDVLAQHTGKVIFYQHSDPSMGFPLGAIFDGEGTNWRNTKHLNEMNYKRIFYNVNYNNKEWILLTHANPQFVVSKMQSSRFQYSLFNRTIRMDMGRSPTFDVTQRIVPLVKRPYHLLYIGREKTTYRTNRLTTLYGDDDCTRVLIGLWDHPPDNFDYKGYIEGHGNVYLQNMYGLSIASIVTADRFFLESGMMTTRLVESIMSGNLTLIDSEFEGASHYLPTGFVVTNHEEVHRLVRSKPQTLASLITMQRKYIRTWQEILNGVLGDIE